MRTTVAAREALPQTERRLSESLARLVDGRWRQAELVLLVVAAAAAWIVRFVQDDAFITYRYARNLARGEGLVFNEGEFVEGYTNFLWTVIHWIPEKLGWSTPVFSQILGICLMVATVAVTLRLARRVFRSDGLAFLVALVLVANMTFLTYATGGLETMQQTLLVTSVAALLLPYAGPHDGRSSAAVRRVGAGICAGLAVLTRLDSALLIAVFVIGYLVAMWRGEDTERRVRYVATAAAQIAVPAAVLLVPWFAWKLSYYGDLLPNTFYAKSAASPLVPYLYGLFYLAAFFISYAAFLLIGRFLRYRRELFAVPGMVQLLAVVPAWFIYICVVGADFMEFRFMVPIMPVLAMVAAFLIDRYRKVGPQVLLVATLLVVSGLHRPAPSPIPYPVLTFTELSHWPNDSATSWKGMGELLGREFPGGPALDGQPTIALAPLGVLPYQADLPAVDMLGLTDPVTARSGYPIELYYPGHVRMAKVEHLLDQDVNLVIAQPALVDADPDRAGYRLSELTALYPSADLFELPEDAAVIEIPLTEDQVWTVIYLQQNDLVDAAIERNGWGVVPIERECVLEDMDVVDGDGAVAGFMNRVSRQIGERTCPAA